MITINNILTEALTEALETMAFLTIIPMDDDMVVPEKMILGEIQFVGPKNGTIQVLVGVELSATLAENIGNLTEVDYEMSCDAIKELCNVTCGLLLPRLSTSPTDIFDLTVPTVESCEGSSQWSEFTSDEYSEVLNVEGSAVATKVLLEKD